MSKFLLSLLCLPPDYCYYCGPPPNSCYCCCIAVVQGVVIIAVVQGVVIIAVVQVVVIAVVQGAVIIAVIKVVVIIAVVQGVVIVLSRLLLRVLFRVLLLLLSKLLLLFCPDCCSGCCSGCCYCCCPCCYYCFVQGVVIIAVVQGVVIVCVQVAVIIAVVHVVVIVLSRLLFYSDFGDRTDRHPAGISRANLDGSNIRVIISKKLVGPQGLSLDYVNQKIYWTDRSLDRIEAADYNGQNRYVSLNVHVVKGMTSVPYLLQLI